MRAGLALSLLVLFARSLQPDYKPDFGIYRERMCDPWDDTSPLELRSKQHQISIMAVFLSSRDVDRPGGSEP